MLVWFAFAGGIPEGAVAIQRPPVPEVQRLSYGEGLPRSADPGALEAMKEGEAILVALDELVPADTSEDSREQAIYVSEQADLALAWFNSAGSSDPALRAASGARAGDTWRLVWAAVKRTLPSPLLLPADASAYMAQVDEAAAPLAESATTAYTRVLGDPMAPDVWKSHVRWGLAQLEDSP